MFICRIISHRSRTNMDLNDTIILTFGHFNNVRQTIYSSEIMLTEESNRWRLYVSSLHTRSSTLKISLFSVEITSVQELIAFTDFMMNAVAGSLLSFGNSFVTRLTVFLVVLSLMTKSFACMVVSVQSSVRWSKSQISQGRVMYLILVYFVIFCGLILILQLR